MTARIAEDFSALTLDTGGTVLDWHTGIVAAFEQVGARRDVTAAWPDLAKQWRRLSTGMVDRGLHTEGGRAEIDMDDVLRQTLEATIDDFGLAGLTEDDRNELIMAWRHLAPWPDVANGLRRLRSRYIAAPFTILKTSLIIEASRHAGLNWDCIISCEMIGIYKTHHIAYETAARWLDLPHERILMVTTHNNDLRAAHKNRFRTAFIHRPDQWGDVPPPDPNPDPVADIVADDLEDLADQLGIAR